MVSLWPWRASEDAASFEKTLNALTSKINRAATTQDRQRQLSRKARVIWTLYAGFAYIFTTVILTLVTGWKNWGVVEGTVVAGGPVVIYGIRYAITSYLNYRISNTDAYLKKLNNERDATIERLKEATKYNSTQQLLEKYGASPKQKEPGASPGNKRPQAQQKSIQPQGPRTGLPPPPTANIQRPQPPDQQQIAPQRPPSATSTRQTPTAPRLLPPPDSPTADFAPNAFPTTTAHYAAAPSTFTQVHWYDRLLDAILGEDETQPKNRLALICGECRLVNGQAPPGAKTLEDVGKWRCGGCSAWNGVEKKGDVENLVRGWEKEREMEEKERARGAKRERLAKKDESDDAGLSSLGDWEQEVNEEGEAETEEEEKEEELPPVRATRNKTRVKGKGKK